MECVGCCVEWVGGLKRLWAGWHDNVCVRRAQDHSEIQVERPREIRNRGSWCKERDASWRMWSWVEVDVRCLCAGSFPEL